MGKAEGPSPRWRREGGVSPTLPFPLPYPRRFPPPRCFRLRPGRRGHPRPCLTGAPRRPATPYRSPPSLPRRRRHPTFLLLLLSRSMLRCHPPSPPPGGRFRCVPKRTRKGGRRRTRRTSHEKKKKKMKKRKKNIKRRTSSCESDVAIRTAWGRPSVPGPPPPLRRRLPLPPSPPVRRPPLPAALLPPYESRRHPLRLLLLHLVCESPIDVPNPHRRHTHPHTDGRTLPPLLPSLAMSSGQKRSIAMRFHVRRLPLPRPRNESDIVPHMQREGSVPTAIAHRTQERHLLLLLLPTPPRTPDPRTAAATLPALRCLVWRRRPPPPLQVTTRTGCHGFPFRSSQPPPPRPRHRSTRSSAVEGGPRPPLPQWAMVRLSRSPPFPRGEGMGMPPRFMLALWDPLRCMPPTPEGHLPLRHLLITSSMLRHRPTRVRRLSLRGRQACPPPLPCRSPLRKVPVTP